MSTGQPIAKRMVGLFGHLFAWSMVAYSLGLLALTILWVADPSQTWWVAVSNIFAIFLFVPLPLLLVCMVRSRSVPMHTATWVMLVLFLVNFGSWLVPPGRPMPEGRPLRVLTFNHYYYNRHPDAVTREIRAQSVDIVTLEELSYKVVDQIEQDLVDLYPYRYLQPGSGWAGQGVLSRFPILEQSRIDDTGIQRLVLDIDGTHVTLLNVHLPSPKYRYTWRAEYIPMLDDYNPSHREQTMPILTNTIDSIAGPLIVMGDFNTAEREESYNQLAQRMTDSYRATNWGLGATYPKLRNSDLRQLLPALVRIDYIWVRDGITPTTAWVSCANVDSDHCMVGAELYLKTTAANGALEGGWWPW